MQENIYSRKKGGKRKNPAEKEKRANFPKSLWIPSSDASNSKPFAYEWRDRPNSYTSALDVIISQAYYRNAHTWHEGFLDCF